MQFGNTVYTYLKINYMYMHMCVCTYVLCQAKHTCKLHTATYVGAQDVYTPLSEDDYIQLTEKMGVCSLMMATVD